MNCTGQEQSGLAQGAGTGVLEDGLEISGGYGDTGVGGAVVESQLIRFLIDDGPGGKDDSRNVAGELIRHTRSKDPFIASADELARVVQVEQGQAHTINLTGRRYAYAVIDDQPACVGFDRLSA